MTNRKTICLVRILTIYSRQDELHTTSSHHEGDARLHKVCAPPIPVYLRSNTRAIAEQQHQPNYLFPENIFTLSGRTSAVADEQYYRAIVPGGFSEKNA